MGGRDWGEVSQNYSSMLAYIECSGEGGFDILPCQMDILPKCFNILIYLTLYPHYYVCSLLS